MRSSTSLLKATDSMDEQSAGHPLLPQNLNSPNQSRKTGTAKRKRIIHCKTAPPKNILLAPKKAGEQSPGSNLLSSILRPSFKQVVLFLVIYIGVGAVCFYLVKDQLSGKKTNGFLDAIYFCIVTMTTVGYGDLVPTTITAKLLACVFVFSGMALVALVLSRAADYLVEKQEALLVKALYKHQKDSSELHLLKKIETSKSKNKLYTTSALLVLLILLGTIFLCSFEKFNFVDAFYCVCSTITTLGYGDKSFSTEAGRLFAVLWIMTSTICLAQFFLYVAEINTEHRQKALAKRVLARRLTFFDLEAADIDDDGAVDAAEFIIYKLKEMGKINQEDIAQVMEEFVDLDIDKSGTLTTEDLVGQQFL